MLGNVRSVTRLYALLSYTALETPPLRWHAPPKEDDTMFATHLATPLQQSLASHVFGRFIARTPPGNPAVAAPGVMDAMAAPTLESEMDEPDLAQRVRELGEW